jgi:hypothetical protein
MVWIRIWIRNFSEVGCGINTSGSTTLDCCPKIEHFSTKILNVLKYMTRLVHM